MYTGIKEFVFSDQELALFYENKSSILPEEVKFNEYIIIKNTEGKIVTKGRWSDKGLIPLKYSKIDNQLFGKFVPRNIEQEFAFDLLQNESITGKLLLGNFGTGKTMIALVHSLNLILGRNPKYERLIYLRNNVQTKNTMDVGALPSDLISKIKPFAMPLADILGEETQLDMLIENGKIRLEHIGFIRGRSYKNSIVMVSEAQNLTRELAGLVVSRIGEGSLLIVEGDAIQCDKAIFSQDSGVESMAEALKGDFEFGMVTLKQNERSRFASLGDKILQYG